MEAKRQYARKAAALVVGASVAVMTLSGCGILEMPNKQQVYIPKTVQKEGFDTAEVKSGNINVTLTGLGGLQPVKTVSLFYRDISGPLKKLSVSVNDEIKKGQLIAEIDLSEISKSILDKELSMQRWAIRNQQIAENLLIASKTLRQAELDLDKAQRSYQVIDNYVNEVNLERSKLNYEVALSEMKNAKWNQELAAIEYKQDVNTLENLKLKIAQASLISPVEGIAVFVEKLSETEMVDARRVIVKVAQQDNMVFQMVAADGRYIQGIKGAVLTLDKEKYEVDSYVPQPGDQLDQTSNDPKMKNRFYLRFNGKKPKSKIGESMEVKLDIRKDNVRLIPKSAIKEENGKTLVDVVSGNQINTVEITRGLEKDDMVEVVGGLAPGTKVVVY